MKNKSTDSKSNHKNEDAEGLLMDKTDIKILNLLQKNNQLTNLELAQLINLSPPPCLRRVRRLRAASSS